MCLGFWISKDEEYKNYKPIIFAKQLNKDINTNIN